MIQIGIEGVLLAVATVVLVVFSLLAVGVPLTYRIGNKWAKNIVETSGSLSKKGGSREGGSKGFHRRTPSLENLTKGARNAARNRYLVFSTLAWVVWGSSFLSALLVMYRWLSQYYGPQLLLVHLGATFICSLFAEVFMISAFVAVVNPDLHKLEMESQAMAEQGEGGEGNNSDGSSSPSSRSSRFSITKPYSIVIILGLSMSILGGILVSLIEFLPDQNSKLVYTCLSGLSILIGVTKTHGLGGWIMHNNSKPSSPRKKKRSGRAQHQNPFKDNEEDVGNWSFWQPGKGGSAFIVTQVFGWCFFAISLLGLAWISKFAIAQITSCGVFCMRRVTVPTAIVMIIAQLVLAGSLTVFQDSESREGESEKGDANASDHQSGAAGANKRYREGMYKYIEDCWLVFLFYCPHYLTTASILVPYLVLPSVYASSIMMGLYLPLHLWGSIGQPQQTGLRESQSFRQWTGRTFGRICERFLGGVKYIYDDDDDDDEGGVGDSEGEDQTQDQDQDQEEEEGKKYIFAYHPHALYPLGVVCYHLMPQFQKRFGSIRPVTLVASVIFRLPIIRDLACLAGVREVTAKTFRNALRDRGAVTLVPGGQAELCVAPRAHSETDAEIVLNTRHKGFIKIAHEYGAHLVPVLCFGEIYQLKNGICLPRLQAWTYKQFGFPVPFLPVGRFAMPIPLNSKNSGHPFTFVIGKPLKVSKLHSHAITREQVNQTHTLYYERIKHLYHKYKHQCGYQHKTLVLED